MSLRVVRHVEGEIVGLAGTEPKVPGFPEWLDNDHPRHSFLSDEIAEKTKEFGIADDKKVLRKFKSLEAAEKARASAKMTFDVEIEGEESQPEAPSNDSNQA